MLPLAQQQAGGRRGQDDDQRETAQSETVANQETAQPESIQNSNIINGDMYGENKAN